jgi:hypothetical protein
METISDGEWENEDPMDPGEPDFLCQRGQNIGNLLPWDPGKINHMYSVGYIESH